ncbi:triose-phosphate isomerase [Oceanicella sp. SM1341]|uniref:triose-phosphate isomerase n=1 Tax=Oceanicella sp. SM1341 TaxID=1548889 RepID=UPI000E500213|nr:triose-phosphate isomerase [Oceanicella sp. SM1341]
MTRRKLAAGNWKMNGLRTALAEIETLRDSFPEPACDVLICPPATLLAQSALAAAGSSIRLGGQDCHVAASGAHTGDISATMLSDSGATHVILGHSERRADHGESSALVAQKTKAAWDAGLTAVVCVGETEAERDAGHTLDIVTTQVAESIPDGAIALTTVVAYEPVWAIGTGRTPTNPEIEEVHTAIRGALARRFGADVADGIRILYGGSVKPGNAAEIFALRDVDGGLVGGASLKASDFSEIIRAAEG